MTRGDLGIIGIVVAILVASVLVAAVPRTSTSEALIKGPGGETIISLDRDATYRVQGAIGEVVIEVEDGEARCVESSCPDQICVESGALAPGRPIVCAPNHVVVTLRTGERGQLDAVSR